MHIILQICNQKRRMKLLQYVQVKNKQELRANIFSNGATYHQNLCELVTGRFKVIRGLKTISEFICQKLHSKVTFLFTVLLPKALLYLFWISLWHIKRQPHSLTINTAARCSYFQKMFLIDKTDLVWNKHFPPKMNTRL